MTLQWTERGFGQRWGGRQLARTAAVQTALLAAWLGGGTAVASPITLFGTGVDDLGLSLAPGEVDPHYTLMASDDPVFPGPETFAVEAALPAGWIAAGGNAQWIAPQADRLDGGSPLGSYLYRTTFDLTDTDPATASISGLWAADNIGLIFLNGIYTGFTNLAGPSVLTPFEITDGFQEGENLLDFVIVNSGTSANPTGLLVDIAGSVTNIPEPS
ncbi:MAG: hypothetical protein ACC645_07585, partial [Pirellulales bacterium]